MTDINLVKNLVYRMDSLKKRSMREVKDCNIDVYSLEWLNFTMKYNTLMGEIDTGRHVKMSDVDRLSDVLDYLIYQ